MILNVEYVNQNGLNMSWRVIDYRTHCKFVIKLKKDENSKLTLGIHSKYLIYNKKSAYSVIHGET